MAELKAMTPFAGLLPLTIGAVRVEELDVGPITSVAPLDRRVDDALGMAFPAVGETTESGGARCLWIGQGEALLMGALPTDTLGQVAAVVDQSDAWAVVEIAGDGVEDVLARLVPMDLRLCAFAQGRTARTQLAHLNASITRTGETRFMIAVFRSMATTLVHDLRRALEAQAARR